MLHLLAQFRAGETDVTNLWRFAYVLMPIVAMGAAGVVFLVPWIERQDQREPGE